MVVDGQANCLPSHGCLVRSSLQPIILLLLLLLLYTVAGAVVKLMLLPIHCGHFDDTLLEKSTRSLGFVVKLSKKFRSGRRTEKFRFANIQGILLNLVANHERIFCLFFNSVDLPHVRAVPAVI